MIYDAVIIGGGFFGTRIALHLAKHKKKVLLLEKESELLQGASYNNQARVHNGYHYPRSILTALRSRLNFPSFVEEYQDCVQDTFEKYYAVARQLSKVSSRQYIEFCQRVGASITPAPERIQKLFNPHLIEDVFTVQEYAFNAGKLKEKMKKHLEAAAEVSLATNAHTHRVVREADDTLRVEYKQGSQHIEVYGKSVLNCTYSNINTINTASNLPTIPFKHELTEMALVEVPEELSSVGITVMCGPFFSLMPFPDRNLHSLSHVRYTPHFSWKDTSPKPQNHPNKQDYASNFPAMIRDVARYLPIAQKSTRHDSLWEIKTVLTESEHDDSRPILFRTHHGLPNYTCILGGKIDNIYDALKEIDLLYEIK